MMHRSFATLALLIALFLTPFAFSQDPEKPVAQQVKAEDKQVIDQLERTLPEVIFEGVGFNDTIDFLRDVTGANIFVNWKAMEAAHIDQNAPVTAKLRNIKFSKALRVVLDSAAGGKDKLGYDIDEGVITISTAEDLRKNTMTRVYDVRGLIRPANGDAAARDEKRIKVLTDLIVTSVAPKTWRDKGGSVGALRELQGNLIVTQTPENHEAIAHLLTGVRDLLDLERGKTPANKPIQAKQPLEPEPEP
jgi:hypothetical protein